MKTRIKVLEANITENKLFLKVGESIEGVIPGEQLLVDSDHFSFIYLMEEEEDYTYIDLPEVIWPFLRTALEEKMAVWLTNGNQEIELLNLIDELDYVIGNIKGNSNYGQEMVKKVEGIF